MPSTALIDHAIQFKEREDIKLLMPCIRCYFLLQDGSGALEKAKTHYLSQPTVAGHFYQLFKFVCQLPAKSSILANVETAMKQEL